MFEVPPQHESAWMAASPLSTIGTVRVSTVKFRSIRLRTLSASLARRFPATASPPVMVAAASGHG
jgi:hypothetical protein